MITCFCHEEEVFLDIIFLRLWILAPTHYHPVHFRPTSNYIDASQENIPEDQVLPTFPDFKSVYLQGAFPTLDLSQQQH